MKTFTKSTISPALLNDLQKTLEQYGYKLALVHSNSILGLKRYTFRDGLIQLSINIKNE